MILLCVIVASRAGAWIETSCGLKTPRGEYVASRAGAWIETFLVGRLWHRGQRVASRAGAWIETFPVESADAHDPPVASRAGAWIETTEPRYLRGSQGASPPVRGRGLKLDDWDKWRARGCRLPCGGVD